MPMINNSLSDCSITKTDSQFSFQDHEGASKGASKKKHSRQKGIRVTKINAEDFIIKIPTKYAKKQNHHIYGDKVINIVDKSLKDPLYSVQWSDGTKSTVSKAYLQEFHQKLLMEFDIKFGFQSYIRNYTMAKMNRKVKKRDQGSIIVIDD